MDKVGKKQLIFNYKTENYQSAYTSKIWYKTDRRFYNMYECDLAVSVIAVIINLVV